jgi:hypothetical protein
MNQTSAEAKEVFSSDSRRSRDDKYCGNAQRAPAIGGGARAAATTVSEDATASHYALYHDVVGSI